MGKIGEIELSRSFTRALVKAGLCNGQMECVIIIKGGAQSFSEKTLFNRRERDGGGGQTEKPTATPHFVLKTK